METVAGAIEQEKERGKLKDPTIGKRTVVDEKVIYKPAVNLPKHALDDALAAALETRKKHATPPQPQATPTPKSKRKNKVVQKIMSVAKRIQKLAPKVPKVSVPKALRRKRRGQGRER